MHSTMRSKCVRVLHMLCHDLVDVCSRDTGRAEVAGCENCLPCVVRDKSWIHTNALVSFISRTDRPLLLLRS